ncbi:TPA: helix-turn-helix domain-containing protein [Legionella pneumophila]|nr:helix-turn-helix domain-containing protein [Legionella pneumophila]HAU1656329.1 helix-turn-helix transcriptional regulator [Legionella pneumophila]
MTVKHQNLIKLGQQIRTLRSSRGYSQEGFAAMAGLGRTYMGRVERGEQNISIQNLIQIAIALDVEVGKLVPPLSELIAPDDNKTDK